ncbi:unnamed protein product [Closterium sp. NIES-54]
MFLLLLLPPLSQPLPLRAPPRLPIMTSLHRSGGSGDGGGGGSGGGGGRPSSRCGAVRWEASGGCQQRQRESLTPQQLREWCTSRGGGGGSSGSHFAAVQLGVPGGGLTHLQRRPRETLTPQQLREWFVQRGASPSSTRCPYVIRTSDRAGQTCGTVGHTQSRCFSCLSDTWRAEFGDATELPRWLELVRQRVEIFALDYDAILTAMYALSASAEGDCYRCVPPDPGVAAAALGASESGTPPGTAPAEALHTFTLDSGASRCFFRDSTNLTPLPAPVPVRLADPSGGPVVAHSSTVLPCPAVLSGSLSGLHLPSFSTNLVSTAALQDAMVTTTTPGGQRVSICTCTRTGRHLATFTRRLGSSLYTQATEPPEVAASAQVSASGQVAASCSCRLLSHQTLRWHHRLGHPSLPRRRAMHSRLLVSGLPRSLPPLPPLPAPPCLPCVEGRQRAAPHSSSFPSTSAPLQTLHMAICGLVWGSRAFVRNTSADKISACAIPCVFLGFVTDALGWQFYHPTSRRVLPSHDVTFDESVPFYRLFPYRSAPPPPPPLFLAPGPPPVDLLPPQVPAPSGVSQVEPLPGTAPVQVAVISGAAPGAAPWGAASGGAEPRGTGSEGAGSGGAEPKGVKPGGAESESAETGGAEPRGVASPGGPAGASPRLSPQLLREWLVRRPHHRSGAPGARGAGDTGAGGATIPTGAVGTGGVGCAGAGDPTEPGTASGVGAGAGVAGVGGPGAGGAGAAGAGVGGTGAGGDGAAGAGAVDTGAGGVGDTPASSLPAPSPYTEQSRGLTEQHEPASRPVSPVHTARRAPRSRPPPFLGTLTMALRPSSVPLRVPRPAPPESSLPAVPDPESDQAHAASPTVARLLATAVTDPSFESAAASALVAELLDFAAACRLDYATALVAESVFASPLSVGGECALCTDILEDRQEDFECLAAAVPRFASLLLAPEGDPDAPDIPTPRSYAEAITGPYSSQWQAAMNAEMASWKSTGTYVDEVPPPGANIVDGMWIFRVKRPPGSPPAFKARYVARGFSQQHGVDYFQTFSPTPKMTTLRVLLHVAAQHDYELHSLDLSTAFLQGSLHEEIWLRRPPGFTGTFPAAYVDDLVYATADTEALTLVKSELQKRHTCTDLGELHSLSPPPLDGSVEPSGPYPELVGCLMYLMTCTRPDLAYPFSLMARYVAPDRHRKVHWDAVKRVLRYLCSTSGIGLVLGGRGPVVLTGHADASRGLRWLTYLLTDLGEQPRSPPVLYVDNKAMIALCQEHGLEHRTKQIALRYFLARELQQRGQLCLAYVATWANTADIFTKALPPSDHQRFATVLGLVPTLPHLLTA